MPDLPQQRGWQRPLVSVERALRDANTERHSLVLARDQAEHEMLCKMREIENLELRIGRCDDNLGTLLDEYLRAKAAARA